MKVVFDTNVLISALISSGTSKEVFEFAIRNDEVFTSLLLMNELECVLSEKFHFSPSEVSTAIHLLRERLTFIPDSLSVPRYDVIEGVMDREDWPHLWFCHAINSKLFVTGDKELVALGKFKNTHIASPSKYWMIRDWLV